VLEALANAVPAVLPDHGAFPELIEATGGGVLHAAEDPQALADVLRQLMADPARVSALGRAGQQAIRRDYHATGMAQKTLELYRRVRARA
jgi:glycosyltransferase involved in cell wall biosynthesis